MNFSSTPALVFDSIKGSFSLNRQRRVVSPLSGKSPRGAQIVRRPVAAPRSRRDDLAQVDPAPAKIAAEVISVEKLQLQTELTGASHRSGQNRPAISSDVPHRRQVPRPEEFDRLGAGEHVHETSAGRVVGQRLLSSVKVRGGKN